MRLKPQLIRESVDFCPDGLCFSMPEGRPILVNRQMNELSVRLTGQTVLDAEAFWAELCRGAPAGGCTPIRAGWWAEGQAFRLSDGTVWQFRRAVLQDGRYVQLTASEVTELCRLSEALYERNRRLRELHARQKELLQGIVEVNREKELLSVKMRVHDELGQCLIATKRSLREQTLPGDAAALAKNWEDAIRGLRNIPLETADTAPEAELLQVAALIGCRIDFLGAPPARRGARLLLCAAVREALTNAVRHANADRLTVRIRRTETCDHIEISDNGTVRPASLREGGGLSNLRRRLEQEGASLQVVLRDGVVLVVEIPEEPRTGGGEHDEHSAG